MVDAARDEDGKEEPDNSSGSVNDVHEESPMNETQLRRMMFVEAMTPGCSDLRSSLHLCRGLRTRKERDL